MTILVPVGLNFNTYLLWFLKSNTQQLIDFVSNLISKPCLDF